MPPDLPPWHRQKPAEGFDRDNPHDTATCTFCGPLIASEAYERGQISAGTAQTHLPLTSAPDPKPGRDGYESETP
jgi:hypothetical protein